MTHGRYHGPYTIHHMRISIINNVFHFQHYVSCQHLFALRTVPSGQRPAAAVRGSAPPGSPQRVAPLRLQQESLQREKEEAQQKERERQAEEREKEEQREEVSFWEDMQQDADFVLLFFLFIFIFFVFCFILCCLGSEAAGSLWAAGEAAESFKRRTEEYFLGLGSLHYYYSALLSQGSHLE